MVYGARKLWGSVAERVRECRLVSLAKNLLWIRRSVVRVHPAVPAIKSARLRKSILPTVTTIPAIPAYPPTPVTSP
jgi:hypothetical protein